MAFDLNHIATEVLDTFLIALYNFVAYYNIVTADLLQT